MDIERIGKAVEAAIQYFGMGKLCRLDALFADCDGSYVVRVRDTRKSQFFGPVFSFLIDVAVQSTSDGVRDFTREQIVERFAKPSSDR